MSTEIIPVVEFFFVWVTIRLIYLILICHLLFLVRLPYDFSPDDFLPGDFLPNSLLKHFLLSKRLD